MLLLNPTKRRSFLKQKIDKLLFFMISCIWIDVVLNLLSPKRTRRRDSVNRIGPSGQFWITALVVAAIAVAAATLSGCTEQPTSDVGAAQPYIYMPGSNDPNSPNCYAYAIGSPVNEQPGDKWTYSY